VREVDTEGERPFKPWGFCAAACPQCRPLLEAFAESLNLFTGWMTVAEFRARQVRPFA
jgi:hypothetical protein